MEDVVKECVSLVRAAPSPLSINEIRKRLPKGTRFSENQRNDVATALRKLQESEAIASWPNFGNQKDLFWNRSFPNAVIEALEKVLDDAPMTVTQTSAALKRMVPKASENRLRSEARAQLRILAAKSVVICLGNYYCALAYLRRIVSSDQPLADRVVDAVAELESGRGNYVSIPDLRASATFRKAIDRAILSAAQNGGLVLARYGGPVPHADERVDLLDAGDGVFFVGVARARDKGAS